MAQVADHLTGAGLPKFDTKFEQVATLPYDTMYNAIVTNGSLHLVEILIQVFSA